MGRVRTDGGQQLVEPPTPEFTQDALFSTLSSQRRRLVLRRLLEDGSPQSVRELTTGVAADENGVPEAELTYKQRKRVYTSLHQTHLQKLDDVGLVEYDRNRGIVALTDRADIVKSYLYGPGGRRWYDYYLGLGLGLTTLVFAVALEVPLFAAVPDILVGAVAAVALLGVSGWHALRSRQDTLIG